MQHNLSKVMSALLLFLQNNFFHFSSYTSRTIESNEDSVPSFYNFPLNFHKTKMAFTYTPAPEKKVGFVRHIDETTTKCIMFLVGWTF